jgi:hypothetical protein
MRTLGSAHAFRREGDGQIREGVTNSAQAVHERVRWNKDVTSRQSCAYTSQHNPCSSEAARSF